MVSDFSEGGRDYGSTRGNSDRGKLAGNIWKHQDTTLWQPVLVIMQHHKEKAEKQALQGKTSRVFLWVWLGRVSAGSWVPICGQFGGGEADLTPVSCRQRVLVRALPA